MVENVLFGNSLGHPASFEREDKGGGRACCTSLTTMCGAGRGIMDQQAMEGYMVRVVC